MRSTDGAGCGTLEITERASKKVAELVRGERAKKGLSLRDVASKCGLTHAGVAVVESGAYSVRLDTVEKILKPLQDNHRLTSNPGCKNEMAARRRACAAWPGGGMFICSKDGLAHVLACGDLENQADLAEIRTMLPSRIRFVYSDPPWNPGIVSVFRKKSGLPDCASYSDLIDGFCTVVADAIARGAGDVFVEQSVSHCST